MEIAILDFTSQLLFYSYFTYYLPADWKMFCHLLFFTNVFSLFRVIKSFFNGASFIDDLF